MLWSSVRHAIACGCTAMKKRIWCDALNWIIPSANRVGYLSESQKKKKPESSIITWLKKYPESKYIYIYHYWDAIAVSLYRERSTEEGKKRKRQLLERRNPSSLAHWARLPKVATVEEDKDGICICCSFHTLACFCSWTRRFTRKRGLTRY